jgi:predicted NBD/HSP70 family sugar kinase
MKRKLSNYYSIGIDVGGTKIRGIFWNGKKIIKIIEIPTPKTKKEFRDKIRGVVGKLASENGRFLLGIGAAGVIDKKVLISSPNLPQIKKFDFSEELPPKINLAVDNDARCFLRAETIFGAAKNAKSAFGVTIGTGIGRAFAEKGIVKKIKKFEYPELWEKEYQKIRKAGNSELLAEFLGKKLASLIIPYNPEVIVIGGGATKDKKFFKWLVDSFKKQGIKSRIKYTGLKKNAAALGAVLIF